MVGGSPQRGEMRLETNQAIMRSDAKRNSHEFEASISVVEATILRGWLPSEAPQIHTGKARPHQVSTDLAGLVHRMGVHLCAIGHVERMAWYV